MRHGRLGAVALLTIALHCGMTSSGTGQAPLVKKQKVFLLIPRPFTRALPDKPTTFGGSPFTRRTENNGGVLYAIDSASASLRSDGQLLINGSAEWATVGLSRNTRLEVDKINTARDGSTIVEFKGVRGTYTHLRLEGQAAEVFAKLATVDSLQYEQERLHRVTASSGLADPVVLLGWLDSRSDLISWAFGDYRGARHFQLVLGPGDTKYNLQRTNLNGRVGGTFHLRVLPMLREFFRTVPELAGSTPLRTDVAIAYSDFSRPIEPVQINNLTIYFPTALASSFVAGDISAQTLINGSVVFVDENRMDIVLSDAVE